MSRTAEQIAAEMREVMSSIGREQYVYATATIRAILDSPDAVYRSDADRLAAVRVAIEAVALVNAGRSQEFGPDDRYLDRNDMPADTTPVPDFVEGTALTGRGKS